MKIRPRFRISAEQKGLFIKALDHAYLFKWGELSRYSIVGLITVGIDLGTFVLLTEGFGWNFAAADIINTPLALTFNFLANKFFAFRLPEGEKGQQAMTRVQIGRYLITVALNQLQAVTIIWIMLNLGSSNFVAKVVQLLTMPVINYFYFRFFVFRKD